MKQPYFLLFAALTLFVAEPALNAGPADHRPPAVAIVSTTSDSGAGSLRAAIETANKNPGTRISFRLGTLSSTISPLAPLPPLLKPNTHLEGNNAVTIVGDKAGASGIGLRVQASRCKIEGLKWRQWKSAAISIRASRTTIEANSFEDMPVGIAVEGAKSRGNRFERNLFDTVRTPIALSDGSNNGIVAPVLSIVRDDTISPVSHKFTLKFKGKAKSEVTLELGYSENEAYTTPKIQKIYATQILKTDANGNATWQFDRKGYPVGSWIATATQNGSTSEFSNTVVLPYLR